MIGSKPIEVVVVVIVLFTKDRFKTFFVKKRNLGQTIFDPNKNFDPRKFLGQKFWAEKMWPK